MVITGTTVALGVVLLGGVIGAAALIWAKSQYVKEARTQQNPKMSNAVAFAEQPAPSGTLTNTKPLFENKGPFSETARDFSHDPRGLHTPSGHANRTRRF